jgi:hypothetical protein
MTRSIEFRYFGLTEAQQSLYSAARALSPSDGLGRMVQNVSLQAYRFLMTQTHVDTGSLRGSERVEQEIPARWMIYIDPSATNRLSGLAVSRYAEVENARGGEHAYIDNTVEQQQAFIDRAEHEILRHIE